MRPQIENQLASPDFRDYATLRLLTTENFSLPHSDAPFGEEQLDAYILDSNACLYFSPSASCSYYNQKWFDYPDIGTAPRITIGCAKEACTDIPEFHGLRIEMHSHCACIAPTQKTELLRKDVRVVVSGPDTADQAVRNALEGYAAGCVATAIAASVAGPQVVASPAGFFAAFKGCITAISVTGVVGGILKEFDIHLNPSDTHWSPL